MVHFVYILANKPRGAIYIGSAADMRQRLFQHRNFRGRSHTNRYAIKRLVWFSEFPTLREALAQERRMKRWRRAWKNEMIEKTNPHWQDVSGHIPF